ncbi:MAG TPA: hypothetical protein PJ982_07920, partial [Lacipirellulaceae bacterium]|nr:hypothetical protein [Lacipirellulaceae bacterium]
MHACSARRDRLRGLRRVSAVVRCSAGAAGLVVALFGAGVVPASLAGNAGEAESSPSQGPASLVAEAHPPVRRPQRCRQV